MCSCFLLSSSCVDSLCTKCYRKLAAHLQFRCLYWNWKLLRLVYCVHWWTDSPWVFWDNQKWIHTVDWSIQTKLQSFILIVVTFILVYVCRRSWHEWKKKPTLAALFECTMTGWVFLKPILQKGFAYVVMSPKWIWFQCTASVHVIREGICSHVQLFWRKWNVSIWPFILCPCARNNSVFLLLQRLVHNFCGGYGLVIVMKEHDAP